MKRLAAVVDTNVVISGLITSNEDSSVAQPVGEADLAGENAAATVVDQIVGNLAANLLDAYRGNYYAAPRWMTFALGHHHVRRIDPRWITSAGHKIGRNRRDDDWNWELRIRAS